MTRVGEIALDVIHGEIFLAHGYSQLPDSIARGCFLRATLDLLEKPGAFCGIVAELMTEDSKGAGRVIKTAGGLVRRYVFKEVAAKCFVLAMHGIFRREKELRFGRSRYPLSSTDSHITIMLYSHCRVKYIVRLNWTRRNVLYAFTNRYALKRHVRVDDSRAKITCSVVGYDKEGNVSYMRSVLEMPNAIERATHSRGR